MRVVFESPSAHARLARAADWLASRPEARVSVISASTIAAAEITRRAIAAGTRRASLGWTRTTLGALAAELARTELARLGLVPASALALEAICARVVHDHPRALGRLSPIRERPGLPRALARTLGELRLARAHDVADAELNALLEVYERELEAANLADRARTLTIATEIARAADPGAVLLADVPLRSRLERDFVEAIAARATAALAVVPEGDARSRDLVTAALGSGAVTERHLPDDTDGPLAPVRAGLFGEAASPYASARAVPEDALTVLSAPGESRECVEIARLVLEEAARGTPFDAMAVLLRAPQYGVHVQEAFRRARVPFFLARGSRRPDPAGRAFLALIACAAERLSARRFEEYLSLGEVPDKAADGAPPPPVPRAERVTPPDDETLRALVGARAGEASLAADDAHVDVTTLPEAEEDRGAAAGTVPAPRHWERLLVEAAVIGGAERWRDRLAGLAAKLTDAIQAYEKKGEAALAEASRRELEALESLRSFALPLVEDLAALPTEATWGEWIDRLGALATRALRRPERVLAVLGELEPMAKVSGVGIGEVRLVLEPRLTELRAPEAGRRYGKVFVATTDEARGLAFDVVFVPGLAEKLFPQKVVEDPLLLDEARQRLGLDLPTNKDRTDDERLALRLAVGAASRRLALSYPRLDVEQARPRTPSFYGLEVLRVAEGELRDFEHLAKRAARTADARIGWPAPPVREHAIDQAEYDLALLEEVLAKPEDQVNGEGRYLVDGDNPHLARALRFRWMRWDGTDFRGSDGFVKPAPEALAALHEHLPDKRSFSPTALQHFAACPYRFFLSAIHRLAPREAPEPIEDLDALQRGSLVHEVQYRLLTLLRDEGLLPVRAGSLEPARERLDLVLAEVAAEFRDTYHPAIERVWEDAITGIGADLREWLRRMSEDEEWTPAHFELSFGLSEARAQDPKSTDAPVVLDIGLRVRGSIDLVERSASGVLRATDHKTGKVRAKKDETVIGGGEILQPVLYALALEKLFAGEPIDGGVLHYCTAAGGFEKVRVPLDDDARTSARVVAKTVGDAIHYGFLPAAPHAIRKGLSACTWCDFKPVCGPYEDVRIGKKPKRPLAPLAQLRRRK